MSDTGGSVATEVTEIASETAEQRQAPAPSNHVGQAMRRKEDPRLIRGRARYVDDINGLRMHVLEAGFETHDRPCVLLLHGFPELSFSWRKVMPALAGAG